MTITVHRQLLESDPLKEQNLPILVSDAGLLFRKYFNRQVKDLGLTAAQWQVLSYIYRRQGLTQTELADILATGKSPLGKKLDALEQKGLVERKTDPQDRRVKRVYMTHRLDPMGPELQDVMDNMVKLAAAGITESNLMLMKSWLRTMIVNLSDALGDDTEKDSAE